MTLPASPYPNMQCTSFYRDPYEHAAWQLYLRECALRAAREEVAFLEATGGATGEELVRIRERVLTGVHDPGERVHDPVKAEDYSAMVNNNTHLLNILNKSSSPDDVYIVPPSPTPSSPTVSLKSVLVDALHPEAVNTLCRKVRPLLERNGITTFKKHQAVHVLRADAQRVLDVSAGLM